MSVGGVEVGCGLDADERTSDAACEQGEAVMQPIGLAEWLKDETQFNLVTALSGCGPAYLFRFIDALAGAATRLGLPEDQAARLALATVRGASTLAAHADVAPGVLADRSEEHTSELQSLMRTSYAVFCLKKKNIQ